MSNQTLLGNAPIPATIDKAGTHLLAPVVDGIIRRFNDDATRAEAALSAVALLQTLKAMGIFHAPAPNTASIKGQLGAVGAVGTTGVISAQRPAVNPDVLKKLQDELGTQQNDEFTRT